MKGAARTKAQVQPGAATPRRSQPGAHEPVDTAWCTCQANTLRDDGIAPAGGIMALRFLFPDMSALSDRAFVVVQHPQPGGPSQPTALSAGGRRCRSAAWHGGSAGG
jgi:chemotaxis response regulator CheB